MVNTLDYNNLIGGLDSRLAFSDAQSNPSLLFWKSSQNVEVNAGLVQRMSGCKNILDTPIGEAILGASEVEYNNKRYFGFTAGDGNYYVYSPNGTYEAKKTDLSTTARSNFTQFQDMQAVCNGEDELFLYDFTTDDIVESNFYSTNSKKGQVCCSFAGRLWVGDGVVLYYSDLGDATQWENDPAHNKYGGYIGNFQGNTSDITALRVYGTYLAIFTKDDFYLLSGDEPSNFTIIHAGTTGISSPTNPVDFDKKQFFFSDKDISLFAINQFQFGMNELSDDQFKRVRNEIFEIVNRERLNEVTLVPYRERNQVWVYIPTGISDFNTCYVLDYNYPEFLPVGIYKRVGQQITCAFNYNNKPYTGTADGRICLEDSGSDFDGTAINFFVNFAFISFGKRSQYKMCEFIKLWVNSIKENNFNLTFSYNNSTLKTKTKSVSFNYGTGNFVLDESVLDGDDVLIVVNEFSKMKAIGKEFFSIQIGINGGQNNDFALRSFSFIDTRLLEDY